MIDGVVEPLPLTDKQRVVLSLIARYYIATGEPCSVCWLARKLDLSASTVQGHLEALWKKGWLPAPAAPRPRSMSPSRLNPPPVRFTGVSEA